MSIQKGALEIACDESGWAGENLLDGGTDVFAHASVRISAERAVRIIEEVRDRIGSPATEYKATHLLRARHRDVLEWFLDRDGPLHAGAHVYLVDKPYAVVRAVAAALASDAHPSRDVDELAAALQRDGRSALGPGAWARFLGEANATLRTRRRIGPPEPIEMPAGDGVVAAAVDLVSQRRAAPWSGAEPDPFVAALDPLLPAIVRTAAYWTADGSAITIVHHQQNTLTEARVAHIMADPGLRGRLSGVRLTGSLTDARVQIADFLAGVARSVASAERGGRGDATLTGLLRPYVATDSVWGDAASWARLRPVR